MIAECRSRQRDNLNLKNQQPTQQLQPYAQPYAPPPYPPDYYQAMMSWYNNNRAKRDRECDELEDNRPQRKALPAPPPRDTERMPYIPHNQGN
jgi:hypothetical protein